MFQSDTITLTQATKKGHRMYVCQLPENIQKEILNDLINAGISGTDLDNAMDSKLIDLEDTIDLGKYM